MDDRIVYLSGPVGVGKTWLVNRVIEAARAGIPNYGNVAHITSGYAAWLQMQEANESYARERNLDLTPRPKDSVAYEEYKARIIGTQTGRAHLVEYIARHLAADRLFLAKAMFAQFCLASESGEYNTFLFDCVGRTDEFHALNSMVIQAYRDVEDRQALAYRATLVGIGSRDPARWQDGREPIQVAYIDQYDDSTTALNGVLNFLVRT